MKLAKIALGEDENKHKCSSCTLHIVLFSTIFTANIRIGTYFIYLHWYLKKDATRVTFGTRTQTTINNLLNGRSQTNRDQKSNLLFLQRHDQSQKFRIKLVKNRQKTLQRH